MHGTLSKFLSRTLVVSSFVLALSQDLPALPDDGPPISITSPDAAATFVYGSIKNHTLIWKKREKVLIAYVTFIDTQDNSGSANEDSHQFRLPGVTLDEAKGIFFARSPKGEIIPVAHFKKSLFVTSIEMLPNATVHIERDGGGNVTVMLEAVSPDDPALHAATSDTRQVRLEDLLH